MKPTKWFYDLMKTLAVWLGFLLFDIRYEGMENIPRQGGYLLVSNHRSNWDPILLTWKVRPMICYMAKEELFKTPIGWVFRGVGAFPVERGSGDLSALDHAAQLLGQGHIVGIFPEGHRSKDGTPLRPKSGAALVAKATGADVLPCCVLFEGRLRLRRRITIRYGRLIPYGALGIKGESPREVKQATRAMMQAVLDLMGAAPQEGGQAL